MNGVRPVVRGAAELLAGLGVAAAVSVVTLLLVGAPSFPEPSWLPESFGTVLITGFVVLAGWLLLRRATSRWGLWLLGTAGPAFLTSSSLGLLLHGTPHYLFGLGGDQLNRVAYVTRFADSPQLADPFYADAAPFYPPNWFWVGGRLAALVGLEGWEIYKPYSILTMAVTGALAFVAWRWLLPVRTAVLFGLATAVVGVHTNAYGPYSWILICLLPQVVVATFVLCGRIVAGPARAGGRTWPLVVAVGVFLGVSALGHTLIAGFTALVVGVVVLLHAWWCRADTPAVRALLGRLAAMAGISAAIALVFWHRYLWALVRGVPTEPTVANDFAPEDGARLPLPMFEMSVTGALCLIGLVWVVVTVWPAAAQRSPGELRARAGSGAVLDDDDTTSPAGRLMPSPAQALVLARGVAVTVVAVFGWFLLSGVRALAGSTLLPFRMIPVLTLVLVLAGVAGVITLARVVIETIPDPSRSKATVAAVVVAALASIQMAQFVPEENAEFAAAARETPGEPSELLAVIDEMTDGREASDLVLLTADPTLSAFRPFFSFQAPAQAYASPAARYEERTEEIRDWAQARSAEELTADLDAGAFRSPDVLVLDRAGADRWVFPALINAMPLESNNRREDIVFRPGQFDDPELFEVREVGDYVVVVRR